MRQNKYQNRKELISENILLLVDEDNANNFSIVEIGDSRYGFAWNGNSQIEIEEIEKFNLIICSVGQKILAFNKTNNTIQLCLGLGFPFSFFEKIEFGFVIVSELTIIVINGFDCSISRFILSSDIIQELKIEDGMFFVKCLDSDFIA